MEFQRNQPIKFGPEFSDIQEVSDVEVSFTGGLREQRDVDVGSGDVVDAVEVELDGQLETAFPWDENLADKNSAEYTEKKNILEADLKNILEADDDIETVEMGDCTFTEAGSDRRRRNADNTTAQASYTLSVMGTNLSAAKAAAKQPDHHQPDTEAVAEAAEAAAPEGPEGSGQAFSHPLVSSGPAVLGLCCGLGCVRL